MISAPFSSGSRISQTGGWATSKMEAKNLLFCQISPQDCMKMKEFGPGGARVPAAPLDPPLPLCQNIAVVAMYCHVNKAVLGMNHFYWFQSICLPCIGAIHKR